MGALTTAAVLRDHGGPFSIERLSIEDPRPDEVLVRIVACGVCQTDAHVRHGRIPTPTPVVLGHEGAGVVEKVGESVRSVAAGDHVVLSFNACGSCATCWGGHPAYCDHLWPLNFAGARLDGSSALRSLDGEPVRGHFFGQSSFATHAVAHERNVVKAPKDLPLELLAPLGCGLQTGAGSILIALGVTRGSSAVVFGVGAVGLAAIMAAKIAGAATIIAVDVNGQRLAQAAALGATHGLDGSDPDRVAREINQITGRGANFILDTSGAPQSLKAGAAALAPLGKFGSVAYSEGTDAPLQASALFVGKSLQGIIQGDAVPQLFIPELIGHFRDGRFPIDQIVRIYDFDDIEQAFADTASGSVVKAVLRMSAA